MNKLLLALAGAAVITAVSTPASATINIYVDDPGALQPEENVLFNEPGFGEDGNPMLGVTNQSSTSVTFVGTETLTAPSGGQSRVEALDGTLDYLKIFLTDPMLAFKEIEFNVERITGGGQFQPFDITVTFVDNFGTLFSETAQIGTGSNWFSAQAIDGQWIKYVELNTAPNNVRAVEQVRIGGIGTPPIPEPATWAMMIAGFGLVGFAARRRRESSVRALA